MNSYKTLFNNSVVFAIGNLGSKLISLILVPFYTYYLTTEQYGIADLILTTVTLFLPIVTASISDAVLRFVLDKTEDTQNIISNSLFIGLCGIFMASIFYPILKKLNLFDGYLLYFYAIIFVKYLESFFSQYTRAIGKIKIFALNGIILSIALTLSNIFLIVFCKLELKGYLISHIMANLISIIYMFFSTRAYKEFQLNKINFSQIIILLKYSVPLIPNSIMWWLINASSRYILLFFHGINSNGLYGIATKIPSIISVLNQIFNQAWQISAIEEFNQSNKKFYSNIFNFLSSSLLVFSSLLIMVIKYIFELLFASDFFNAWEATPYLILGTVFSSLSTFLGTYYIVSKETKGVFKTSLIGGVVSIFTNLFFIPTLGTTGAGISSMISFFVMFLIRYFDTKKYMKLYFNWKKFYLAISLIILQIIIIKSFKLFYLELFVNFVIFLIILVLNKESFLFIFKGINTL